MACRVGNCSLRRQADAAALRQCLESRARRDRLLHEGRVIDFMNVGIGSLRTGIFNVADVCITIGVLLLVLEMLQRSRVSVNG